MPTSVKTFAAGAAVAFSLVFLAACGSGSDDAKADPQASATPTAAKPDLKGIPAVVAVVDQQEITKDEFVTAYESRFQQATTEAQTSGQPVDQDALKKQTAEGLVSNRLLLAEADRRKLTASDADVDKALAGYAQQSGAASQDAYLKTLADQGLDEAEVRTEVLSQLKLDQLLADEAGDKKPTKAELQAIYDEAVAAQAKSGGATDPTQAIPPFEEVQDELKKQAKSTKESAAGEKLLAALRKKATVTVNL